MSKTFTSLNRNVTKYHLDYLRTDNFFGHKKKSVLALCFSRETTHVAIDDSTTERAKWGIKGK